MTTLEILYIIFAAVGAIYLGFSLLTGSDAEVDLDVGDADFDISDAESATDSPSLFSLRTVATFLLGFGVAGIVTTFNDKTMTVQLLSGFGTGFGISLLYFLVMKGMYSMQGDSGTSTQSLIGKIAYITTPTTSSGISQVKVDLNGSTHEYTARSADGEKFKMNDKVKIISAGAGTVTVEKV